MQVHTEGKLQLCFYCGYKNPNFFNLRNHIKRNHPEHGEKKHLWDFCVEVFMFLIFCGKECCNIRSLHVHIDSQHPEHDKKNFNATIVRQNLGFLRNTQDLSYYQKKVKCTSSPESIYFTQFAMRNPVCAVLQVD